MPLRSVKMKRFILGFQRRVWCPKWTPLSRSWRVVTTAMAGGPLLAGAHGRRRTVRPAPNRSTPPDAGAAQTRRGGTGSETAGAARSMRTGRPACEVRSDGRSAPASVRDGGEPAHLGRASSTGDQRVAAFSTDLVLVRSIGTAIRTLPA